MVVIYTERIFDSDLFDFPNACLFIGHRTNADFYAKPILFNNSMPLPSSFILLAMKRPRFQTFSNVEATR